MSTTNLAPAHFVLYWFRDSAKWLIHTTSLSALAWPVLFSPESW
jgi:hypothetical protein